MRAASGRAALAATEVFNRTVVPDWVEPAPAVVEPYADFAQRNLVIEPYEDYGTRWPAEILG